MKSIINPRTGVLASMILVAGAWRIFAGGSHMFLANFTPVGAMALFGGVYFADKKKAYIVPILALLLSDVVLNSTIYATNWADFIEGMAWCYGSFALTVLMGTFIKKVNVRNIVLASISSAILFWLISDFGVWIGGTMYPKTGAGFIECYAAAIPFLKNMLLSNLVFGGVMFGVFEAAKYKFPVLAVSKA